MYIPIVYRIQADETESDRFSETKRALVLRLQVLVHVVLRWREMICKRIVRNCNFSSDEAGATLERSASLLG